MDASKICNSLLMLTRFAPFFAIAATLLSASTPNPVQTTLCAVVRSPQTYNGKVIRFRAGVLTDWHHGTVLVHSHCRNGVELTSTDEATPQQSQALDTAIGTPMDGGYDRT